MSENRQDRTTDTAQIGQAEDICGTLTLELEDGVMLDCEIITVFTASNRQQYIAVAPVDEDGGFTGDEVYLYRCFLENGEPRIDNIEDDEEYEIASDSFDEWLDEREYDEIVDAMDEDPEE